MIECSEEEYYYKLDNMMLSTCQHIRKVFRGRVTAETGEDWADDIAHVNSFIEGVGKAAFKKAPGFQKAAMKNNNIEEWDLPLLSLVIQTIGCQTKYAQENSALHALKKIRNELAHHSTEKITRNEFDKNVQIYISSLQSLGMDCSEIDKMINSAGKTSSLLAQQYMQDLHMKADKCFNAGQIENAKELYSEAVSIPSLFPAHLGMAYENRAACYLKLVEDVLKDENILNHAHLDINNALDLNDSSWNAHYLAGQYYKWKNNLSKAIHHYERSLAISPSKKQIIKPDLDCCKVLAGAHHRNDHRNPTRMPMNLQERIHHLEDETGLKVTESEFLRNGEMLSGCMVKGQSDVFRGHKYTSGWNTPQDLAKAVEYYAKAAEVKNTEGMYNLAICYQEGRGVKLHIQKSLQILRETAEIDRNWPGQKNLLGFNVGVAGSQFAIGLMYDSGIGVDQDYRQAAKWYQRAMENGAANAANNLGILYEHGKGVPRDDKMAEMCWKQAVNLKDYNAPNSLVKHYFREMEPEKALAMAAIGKAMLNMTLIKIPDEVLQREAYRVKVARLAMEPDILEFEKSNLLDTKGLTFQERVTRRNQYLDPRRMKFQELLQDNGKEYYSEHEDWGGKSKGLNEITIQDIQKKASEGSVEATKILKTLYFSHMVQNIMESEEILCQENSEFINSMYSCVTMELHLFQIKENLWDKLKSIIAKLFEEKCFEKGEQDMKVRLCYIAVNLSGSIMRSDDMYPVELLKEGVRRYPENCHYYDRLTSFLGYKHKHEEGIYYAEEALKRFPNNVELLYNLAVHLRMAEINIPDAIQVYKKFLSLAPPDHRKVPEAYYQISRLYLEQNMLENPPSKMSFELTKSHFKMGLESEKNQLACYLPYGESNVKSFVEGALYSIGINFQPEPTPSNILELERSKGVLERRGYLRCLIRKSIILHHRNRLQYFQAEQRKRECVSIQLAISPKLKQSTVQKMSLVTPITLVEMNPGQDCIFHNRILELTIMDDPNPNFPSIHLIAEDDNGDMARVYIYNVEKSEPMLEDFMAGCRVGIINPYMRIGALSITNGIRVDDPRCIVFMKKIENMCRFCGEENAARKCSQCKRLYCSRACQSHDWKKFNHKLICCLK